jgi:hypothetical protein
MHASSHLINRERRNADEFRAKTEPLPIHLKSALVNAAQAGFNHYSLSM